MEGIFTPVVSYPNTVEGYRKMKLEVLYDCSIPITETLRSEINKRTTFGSLDNFCKYVLDVFWEHPKANNEYYFKLFLACNGATTISANDAMKLIGHEGFYELVRKKFIKPFGVADGITIYAL